MKLIAVLSILFYSYTSVAADMKFEGSCSGNLDDDSQVKITYYSNFNGCKKVSNSALAISSTSLGESVHTGTRRFSSTQDIHSVKGSKGKEILALRFKNSTGNTSAIFKYIDEKGVARVVPVQCEVRDYEYQDC